MKDFLKRFLPLLLVVAVIASACWYVLVYDRETMKDFLMAQARSFAQSGHFDTAAWIYDISYQFAGEDVDVALDLATLYRDSGNYTKAEYTLVNAIADRPTAELYIALCDVYVEQDKLLDAANMLDGIADVNLKTQLDAMRPTAPQTDHDPGFYSQYITLNFTGGSGTLYVSTDGEYPSTENAPCTGPISLEAGETKIYALTVAENGLVSPLSVLTYTVGGVVEEVEFADVYLEEIVREKLMYGADTVIYTDALWSITELTVPEEIIELQDLQYMTYLEKLTLQNRTIEDLSFLSGMVRLQELDLSGCTFGGKLDVIQSLPALEKLNVSHCMISSLNFLKGAPMLKELDLSTNAVGNLSVLSTIPTLEVLDIHDNAVSDLAPLKLLPQLRILDVSENLLTSVQALVGCTALTELNISSNKIAAIGVASELPNLRVLRASKNLIVDTTPLAKCSGLQFLDISGNRITDISALDVLVKLEEFYFSNNTVEELPAWPATAALVIIDGSYNQISSLSPLDRMESLNYIYMDYNEKISKISFLADNPNMVQINVYGTKVSEAQANRCMDRSIIVHYDPT